MVIIEVYMQHEIHAFIQTDGQTDMVDSEVNDQEYIYFIPTTCYMQSHEYIIPLYSTRSGSNHKPYAPESKDHLGGSRKKDDAIPKSHVHLFELTHFEKPETSMIHQITWLH